MMATRAFLGSQRTRRPSRPLTFPRLTSPAALPQSILLDVCERAAARLNIEWPAPQSATDQERDVYDGKLLGPPPGPRKQLFPVLPACAKHMRHYWSDPLNLKHGLVGLEVKAELLDDLGQQLDKGSPSPTLWKEILTVNDLVLQNARQTIQACGHSMALSVVGERALWLNLSGLPDSEKRRIAGAPVESGQALFGPAVALMQQRCDDKKK
ncbi:neuron navigator 3-like protein [Labeo rohita]|uniref:Neuron navigator 3-like protein n=1 Tax=Labeo rohita TaxID=84645 RepID=A0A498NKM8_LABRO|nr:neuron navigator 3-like protein [Labeo rohita]